MFELSDQQKISFADVVLSRLDYESISAISKSEIELLIFKAFLEAGVFTLTTPPFEVSQMTMLPLSKVEALIYKTHLGVRNPNEQFLDLARNLHFVDADSTTGILTLSVENKYFRELLISKLKTLNVFVDGTFNKELLKISEPNFDAVIALISPLGAKELQAAKQAACKQYNTNSFIDSIGPMLKDFGSFAAKTTLEVLMKHCL